MRHLAHLFRAYSAAVRRFAYHDILHADDPPHRLALGAAIGVFIAFLPAFGLQMLLVVFCAWLLKANKAIGVPVVWVSNPATAAPIYYACFLVGRGLLGYPQVGAGWWSRLASPPPGLGPRVAFYWSQVMEIAAPLWIGSIVLGLAVAMPCYYLVYYGVCSYRARRRRRIVPAEPRAKRPPMATASTAVSSE